MKPSWKERNTFERSAYVIQILVSVGLIFCLISEFVFKNDLSTWVYPLIALESGLEAIVQWKHSRKVASISLVLFVICIAVSILNLL